MTLTAAKFHIPVMTSTANAGHANRLNARAASLAEPSYLRSTGNNPARVNCPPTQIVAASTCRVSLIVAVVGVIMGGQLGISSGPSPMSLRTQGRQYFAGGHRAVVDRRGI